MITVNMTQEQAKLFEDAASMMFVAGYFSKETSVDLWQTVFNARIEAQVKEEMNQEQAS